ncbi:MAG: hypothetical protein OXH75_25220, partial [Acidobacteria bacterium]|nr:hypothetical protein [Acidobacteriota bacterium]
MTIRLHAAFAGALVLAAFASGLPTGAAAAQEPAGPAAASATGSAPAAPAEAAEYGALLQRYCVTCHNGRLLTAGLSLDVGVSESHVAADAELWEKVVQKLRS